MASSSCLRFDAFAVDAASGELRRDGVLVPIQDLPLRLLLVLLERPRQVVTRDELRQRLWADTVIDFDAGLNTAVRKLREALGDNAEEPRFLETIPRKGYRLLVDVERPPIDAEPARAPGAVSTTMEAHAGPAPPPMRGQRRVWWWSIAAGLVALPLVWLTLTADQVAHRLLIVPFQSAAAEQLLADEISDELIGHVGRIAPGALEVLGPMTARRYRATTDALSAIGREVGATHVLTGRVLREGERLRVTVSLARVSDGVQVWSEIVEPESGSLPQVTARVVTSVAQAVGRRFDLAGEQPQARAGTLNAAAFDAYVRGRAAWYRFDEAGFREGRALFEEAVRVDPDFVDAYIGAADASNMLALSGVDDAAEQLAAAVRDARTAVTRAPEHAAAHAALAMGLFYAIDDWSTAETEFERALALDPGSALFHQWAAGYAAARGDHPRAIALARRAQALDPVSPWVNFDLCWYYYYARRYAEAADQAARAALNPKTPSPWFCRELAFRQLGDEAGEVGAYVEQLRRFSPSPDAAIAAVTEARGRNGIAGVRQLRLARIRSAPGNERGYLLATAAMAAGDTALALQVLHAAASTRPVWWPFLRVDPSFDNLRSERAFQALLDASGPPPTRVASETK